jgi:hypothetical protein
MNKSSSINFAKIIFTFTFVDPNFENRLDNYLRKQMEEPRHNHTENDARDKILEIRLACSQKMDLKHFPYFCNMMACRPTSDSRTHGHDVHMKHYASIVCTAVTAPPNH